jgi:hypothetical protein
MLLEHVNDSAELDPSVADALDTPTHADLNVDAVDVRRNASVESQKRMRSGTMMMKFLRVPPPKYVKSGVY